jgi:DNA-binding phage protein
LAVPTWLDRATADEHCAMKSLAAARRNMRVLEDKAVIRLLDSEVEKAGGQSAWARTKRVSRSLLNRVLNGCDPMPPSIIKVLKLRTVSQRNMRVLSTYRDVTRLLHLEVKKAGGQSAWARRECVNRTVLNKVLKGHKPISPSIKKALKLRTVHIRMKPRG